VKKALLLYIDEDLYDNIKNVAQEYHLSISSLVRMVLSNFIKEKKGAGVVVR